jgi:hypothetical protein
MGDRGKGNDGMTRHTGMAARRPEPGSYRSVVVHAHGAFRPRPAIAGKMPGQTA